MKDSSKTKDQLIEELTELRRRLSEPEVSDFESVKTIAFQVEDEDQYRLLISNIPYVTWISDALGHTTFISSNIEKIYGFTAEEVLKDGQKLWLDRVHIDDKEILLNAWKAFLEKDIPYSVEYRIERKDGEWIWLSDKAIEKRDKEGVKVSYGVFIDITGRKKAEYELLEERDRAQSYFDMVESVMVVLDTEGCITGINRKGCEILGRTQSELNGRNWFETCLPRSEEAKDVFSVYKKMISGAIKGVEYYENNILTSSGEERLIAWHNNYLRNKDGEIIGTLSSGEDITERKKAEEKLQRNEERLNLAMSVNNDGMYDWDVPSNKIYFDPRYYTMAGYEPDEFPGTYEECAKRVHPDDYAQMKKTVDAYLAGEIPKYDEEFRFRRKDGEWMWIRARVKVVERDEGGTPIRIFGTHTNVTERKWMEEKLQDSERASRAWLENSPVCTKVVDLDFNLQYMSEAGITCLKIDDVSSHYGKPFPFDYYPDPFRELIAEKLRLVKRTGETATLETPVINTCGDILWFHSTYVPVNDNAGQIDYMMVVSVDITERKRAEEALKESNERFEAVMDGLEAIVYVADMDTYEVIFANKHTRENIGDIAGKLCWQSIQEGQSGPCAFCTNNRLLDKEGSPKGPWTWEFQNTVNKKWYYIIDRAIRWNDGRIVRLEIATDITEHRQAELMILKLGRILEDSLNEIVVFDFKTLKYLEANHGARTNMGYSMEELKELTPADITSNMAREEFESEIEPLRSGEVDQLEFLAEQKRKDGSTYFAEVHMQKTTFEERPALVSIILDVTEREEFESNQEQLQNQLHQSQKMEAVGVLAAGVAHDFNNIITIIRLRSEKAMAELGKENPVYTDIKEIYDGSKSASELTRQLLLFSRKQALEFVNGDLNVLIVGLLKMLGRIIGEDISIKTDLEPGLSNVLYDKGSIEQILLNLTVNARDAMDEGGTITIKTENVVLDKDSVKSIANGSVGNFVRLFISDTGKGMDEETRQHIFDPFFTTKEPGKGTGLGLSVVYGIVKQHEGWIDVESATNEGTTFVTYLPSRVETMIDEMDKEIDRSLLEGDGKRVLLVEDESRLREVAAKTLESIGYVVFQAANSAEARKIFAVEGGNFNLILSDVVMPGGSGVELVESLLEEKPGLNVLLTSGYTDEWSQYPLIKERGYNFIQKPYSAGDLFLAAKNAISKNS